MNIELRADCDYSNVPVIEKFKPEMTIASGVSAPKIVTCIASDGSKYKLLVSAAIPAAIAISPNTATGEKRQRRSQTRRNHGAGFRTSQ
jgi:hypothetical protein